MMGYLSSGPLNLGDLKNSYQNEFLTQLDRFPSPKEHGVSNSFLLELSEDTRSPPDCKAVIFVINSNIKTVDCIWSFISRDTKFHKSSSKEYHIVAVPSFSYACKNYLKEKDVSRSVSSVYEFPLTLLPVDYDVVSMEEPECYMNYSLAQRQQDIYQFVQGLLRFQSIFGLFPRLVSKGAKANEVARMLVRMRHEAESALESKTSNAPLNEVDSQTDMLIILDRSVDCLTPLLSQLTYEGLINEKWGIRYGVTRLTDSSSEAVDQMKRVTLNGSDEVFAELRDQNFSSVGSILSKRSKEVSALVTETKTVKELPELRRVVNQLPELRSARAALEIHTSIAEKLHKFVYTDVFMLSLSAQQVRHTAAIRKHQHIQDDRQNFKWPIFNDELIQPENGKTRFDFKSNPRRRSYADRLQQVGQISALHLSSCKMSRHYWMVFSPIPFFYVSDFLNGFETDKAHPYIEECILRMAPIEEVLQLMCIQSFCNGGLKQKLLEYYKRELLQVYGFEHMFTLDNLDRIGLLYDSSTNAGSGMLTHLSVDAGPIGKTQHAARHTVTAVSSMFGTSLKKNLRLLIPPTTSQDSADMDQLLAQIYSGYVPISVRLVQALSLGWLPKTVTATAGQLMSTGPSTLMTKTASALLTGKSLVSGIRSDVNGNDYATKSSVSSVSVSSHQSQLRSSGVTVLSENADFIVNLTPGALHEELQLSRVTGKLGELLETCGTEPVPRNKAKVIAVAFVGGITHAEVSALRTLAAISDANLEFIFITTGFLNARTFLASLSQAIQPVQLLPF
ncbi:vacuolar protein sorting-associated protein 33 [Paragonimus westermani]|uniref:Vacuolar protein sorting-associated protein 33 n=1 Tax=Paragonimus westermani TaxID=34504 RepID=A0A5J4P2S5_9TREM|nr:vacuolar protein sorting-associated protein 33 [Paragonimus westermani]